MIFSNGFSKRFIAIIIGAVIIVLFFFSLRVHLRWSEHAYSGKVISITDNSFVIQEGNKIKREIVVNNGTVIKRGIENIAGGLQVGDIVIVTGLPDPNGQIDAKLVRILEKNR